MENIYYTHTGCHGTCWMCLRVISTDVSRRYHAMTQKKEIVYHKVVLWLLYTFPYAYNIALRYIRENVGIAVFSAITLNGKPVFQGFHSLNKCGKGLQLLFSKHLKSESTVRQFYGNHYSCGDVTFNQNKHLTKAINIVGAMSHSIKINIQKSNTIQQFSWELFGILGNNGMMEVVKMNLHQ